MDTNTLFIFMLALFASAVVVAALIVKRAVVTLRPAPQRRGILPMSTGVPILPTQSAQITARPQLSGFRPERLYISDGCTRGGAADWVVNDIKIANQSQFIQSGDIPGDMFAADAIDAAVSFDAVEQGGDVVLVVTYIGSNEKGVPFFASFIGESVGPVRKRNVKLQLVPNDRKAAAWGFSCG